MNVANGSLKIKRGQPSNGVPIRVKNRLQENADQPHQQEDAAVTDMQVVYLCEDFFYMEKVTRITDEHLY